MKHTRIILPFFLLLALLAVSACQSPLPPEPQQAEPWVLREADLTITLSHISKARLEKLYGANTMVKQENPYVDFPAYLTKKRFVVFNFTAETTQSTVNFKLTDINLSVHSATGKGLSRSYLKNIWSGYVDTPSLDAMDRVLKKTILPLKFTVSPEKPVSGYLVFGANYPENGGKGEIRFFVSTPQGDTGSLELPMEFGPAGRKAQPQTGGTGIFRD